MSVPVEPRTPIEPIVVTPTGVMVSNLHIEETRLAEWLAKLTPGERVQELVDIIRLGLAVKMNNQIRELNESLSQTTAATLEQLGAKMQTSMVELESKLKAANRDLELLLSQNVTGDNSKLKIALAQTFEEMRQGLQQTRLELVQALDPRHTESIGAQLEQRLRDYFQSFTHQAITPKLDAVSEAIVKLESAIAGQERVKQERLKGHSKGKDYEIALLEAIQEFALPSTMLIRRVADEKGVNGSKDGDLVIEYDNETLVTIECKDAKSSKLDQLESAIVGRQARIGIMAHKHPNGPTAQMAQGSVRIAGPDKILLVWDPEEDDPAVLTAVIGLAVMVAQRIAEFDKKTVTDSAVDIAQAQAALDVLLEKLELTATVVQHFDRISDNAEKGKKAVEKLKKELTNQFEVIAEALGMERAG
ncbi:MAG: hypothetical protein OWU84_14375 [Firmicutes bacterium]|nr:hypothetical protein [Bacillota bacterium]